MSKGRVENLLQELQDLRSGQFAIVSHLRDIVMGCSPKITEEVKYGGILFSSSKPFCGIFSYSEHVSIEFSDGAALQDMYGDLVGNGKFRRHIKLEQLADVEEKHVAHFVNLARKAADDA